jgi:ABC-type Fe3+/spermidine/putrescine transport system ATPase subunit
MNEHLFTLDSVSFGYAHDGFRLTDINLKIRPGVRFGIIGPNGSGKSTLLKVMGGHLALGGGHIYRNGEDISSVEPGQRGMSTVFQSFALFPHMTVEENVDFGVGRLGDLSKAQRRELVRRYLSHFGLEGHERKTPEGLSGGQKQRVALARAIITKPALLLLDEPTASLDTQQKNELAEVLDETSQWVPETSIVVVTHDYEFAFSVCPEMAIMNAGRIAAQGTTRSLVLNPETISVASILGGYSILRGRVDSTARTFSADGISFDIGHWADHIEAGAYAMILRADAATLCYSINLGGNYRSITGVIADVQFRGSYTRAVIDVGDQRIISDMPRSADVLLEKDIPREGHILFSLDDIRLIALD